MKDIMLDLETYGTRPGAIILSIGAIYFGLEGLGQKFYSVIRMEDCARHGLKPEAETIAWWNKQSPEARKVIEEASSPKANSLIDALKAFNTFVKPRSRVWGNGAAFDNVLIRAAYDAIDLKPSWSHRSDMCYRTLRKIFPVKPLPERPGVYHNALDDAKYQAHLAIGMLRRTEWPA